MKNRLLVAAFSIVLLSWPNTAGAACQTFSGRATVVQANVLGLLPVTLSDTGNLDSTGGAKDASLLDVTLAGLVTGEVMHATAVGQGNSSRSEASVAKLNLTVAGNIITADFLMARAGTACGDGVATVDGSSEIAGLAVNGLSIFVTGSPNQTLSLPGGVTMIINEQVGSAQGSSGNIQVNALHVTVPLVTDVVVSSAVAGGIAPLLVGGGGGGEVGSCNFVTGGGWIMSTVTGAKANFGVAGRLSGQGHLEYIDHGNGTKVHGIGNVIYTPVGPTSAMITGNADITDPDGTHRNDTYTVNVTDAGEPGRNDSFSITVPGYGTSGGTLVGGNIQCHTK
jgi:hypothetical protein